MNARPWLKAFCATCLLAGCILFWPNQAQAIVSPQITYHHLPKPPFVSKLVWFWENIFTRYPSTSAVVHDKDFPWVIVDVIDFHAFEKRYGKEHFRTRKQREYFTERYIKRYVVALGRIRMLRNKALTYGAMEERIYNVYKREPEAFSNLMNGRATVRAQLGLADEFKIAATRARSYLPQMERIFREHQLPIDLTRLAFVESMFNNQAISKVGASGIWQLMPATARRYIIVNRYYDERNSPLKATRSAAKILADSYRRLKSWPLAITAYNHGEGGIAKAVKSVGSSDLDVIIRNYKSNTFGFASRNFYAEFLAARKVYDSLYKEANANVVENAITAIKLTKKISISQILQHTRLDKATFQKLNPCILPEAFSSYRYLPLPRNYEIFVPTPLAKNVEYSLNLVSAKRYPERS